MSLPRRSALFALATAIALATVGLTSPDPAEASERRVFCDVGNDTYYTDAVRWARSAGIVEGVSPTSFAPDDPTTRGQIVTLLYRYVTWRDGAAPAAGGPHGFGDVVAGAFYEVPVRWAASTGLTTGVAPGRFDPGGSTTRGQLATFVHRLSGSPAPGRAAGFSDVAPGIWYADAVAWMAAAGLTTGTSPTTYSPDRVSTRAEIVTFLWRLAGFPSAGTVATTECPTSFTAIGDSVMLGAALFGDRILAPDTFPGIPGTLEIGVCRGIVKTVSADICGPDPIPSVLAVIQQAVADNTLGDVLFIHTGTNVPFADSSFDAVVEAADDADMIWFINVSTRNTWETRVNNDIAAGVARWKGKRPIGLLDWHSIAASNPAYLEGDGTHLTYQGATAFVDMMGNALGA